MHNLHKKFFVAAIMGGLLLPTLCAAAPAEPEPSKEELLLAEIRDILKNK